MSKFNGITECSLCGGNVRIERHDSNSHSYINLDKAIITNLKKQIEVLERSNSFYADLNNWILENLSNGYPILIHKEQLNGGKLARQTQKELKELRGGECN